MKKLSAILFMSTLILASCGDDDDDDDGPDSGSLSLDISGLEDLGSDYAYEGWIIVDGAPVSTGVFDVSSNGALSQTSFDVDAEQLAAATAFVLSIEPSPDSDPAPAATKLLSGSFSGNSASVTVDEQMGDFSNAAGVFFLRTPTDETGTNNGNDEFGVWFGNPGAPPTAGLNLPTLGAGWIYEGWVVGDGDLPLSTGTFTAFDTQDDFNGFSGAENTVGPPIPGEDFFLNAPSGETFPLDVRGRTVVISVEPVPDNSPAPFAAKPLVGTAGQETAPATHEFGQNTWFIGHRNYYKKLSGINYRKCVAVSSGFLKVTGDSHFLWSFLNMDTWVVLLVPATLNQMNGKMGLGITYFHPNNLSTLPFSDLKFSQI